MSFCQDLEGWVGDGAEDVGLCRETGVENSFGIEGPRGNDCGLVNLVQIIMKTSLL